MSAVIFILLAYLLGSIPFGLFVANHKGIDIRSQGSGNVGATNVFRVIGKGWGIFVFALDALKGLLAVILPYVFLYEEFPPVIKVLIGVTAILGHTFPVWLKFKGGKGVATSLGVFMGLCPLPTLLTFLLWVGVFIVTHIISMASLCAAVAFPIILVLVYRHHDLFPPLLPISLLLVGFIFYTHRANIARLRQGQEKKLF